MASFQILPPEQFDFAQPEQWPRWYGRFQRLRQASGLTSKSEENQVNTLIYSEKVVKLYPDLFTGLGTLGVEYHIQLKQEAKPYAITTPQRVALPLLPKVKQELTRMENMGVITRVDNPTEWCVGMVVVPKPNNNICMRQFDEA